MNAGRRDDVPRVGDKAFHASTLLLRRVDSYLLLALTGFFFLVGLL
jgi:hypothetical protein